MNTDRKLRILIANDDGVFAPGIKVLEKIVSQITDDYWIVAPKEEQSGVGHSISLRNPLRLTKVGERKYHVNGSPADCVIIALEKLLKDNPPDIVITGINNGENTGECVMLSGTIAAAREATRRGFRAIAVSLVTKEVSPVNWEVAEQYGERVIRKVMNCDWPKSSFINVNFPHISVEKVKGIKAVPHGQRVHLDNIVECLDPYGQPYYWVGVLREEQHHGDGTDLDVTQEGYISVTVLKINQTDLETTREIAKDISMEFTEETVKWAGQEAKKSA